MLLEIAFLPDSELILPGRSGAESALDGLEQLVARLLREALDSGSRETAWVFAAPKSKFGRPLPGLHIAERLLNSSGFAGEIRDAASSVADLPSESAARQLWLVMGTGAATHGPAAPLPEDSRGAAVDVTLAEILETGRWAQDATLPLDLADEVGATLASGLQRALSLLNQLEAPVRVEDFHAEQQFGVTYFAGRWTVR